MRLIRQAISTDSLFFELQRWCRIGAGKKGGRILIISAFASGAAIEALEPFFDVFLSNGNSIEVIIGIDRNGTDKDAVRRLFALQETYLGQFICHVFQAPSKIGIFHPKLYLYCWQSTVSAIVGSANLTLGGLGNNFESLFLYRELPIRSKEARYLFEIWDTFSTPKMPLKPNFLQKLTRSYVRKLLLNLPPLSRIEADIAEKGITTIWEPISKVKLPLSNEFVKRNLKIANLALHNFLLIDILQETRSTQMQLPLAVVKDFFQFARDQAGEIKLSYIRSGEITQPIERHIVMSTGKKQSRLMRRIEMPQIAKRVRPLAAIFFRLSLGHFAVILLPRGTSACQKVFNILQNHGQQPKHAKRRYYIGGASDPLLRKLKALIKSVI